MRNSEDYHACLQNLLETVPDILSKVNCPLVSLGVATYMKWEQSILVFTWVFLHEGPHQKLEYSYHETETWGITAQIQ